MLAYLFLIIWCLFWGYFADKTNIKKKSYRYKTVVYGAPLLMIFLISALRYNVGTDYAGSYTETYELLLANRSVRMDFLPLLLYKIIIFFNANLQWFFIATSFVTTWFVCKSIKEQSNNKSLSYFIYICGTYYFFSMNGVRQAMAMALFYYSLKYVFVELNKAEIIKYIKNTVIGALLHLSEIMFVPLIFLLKKQLPTLIKIASLVVLYISSSFLMPYIFNIMARTKYAMYVSHWKYQAMDGLNTSMIINLLILAIYEVVLHREKHKGIVDNSRDVVYSNIHYLGALVSMFATSLPLCLRIFMNFRYIEFLSIPNLLTHVKKKYRKIATLAVYILYFLYFVYMVGIQNGNEVLPYKTIFEKGIL